MKIVILAAGKGARFKRDVPKCLSMLGQETVVSRQINQIIKFIPNSEIIVVTGFKNDLVKNYIIGLDSSIKIVCNNKFEKDQNIYSVLIGIKDLNEGVLILEGDCVFSDFAFQEISKAIDNNSSNALFFLGQQGDQSMANGVVKFNNRNQFSDFLIGLKNTSIAGYHSMIGVTWIPVDMISEYRENLESEIVISMKEYYFKPLLNPPLSFNVLCAVIKGDTCTFNTQDEFKLAKKISSNNIDIVLYPVSKLIHIEEYNSERVQWLLDKILLEKTWTRPLCISSEGLVMDGQHRMEVAKRMGLNFVPVLIFDYSQVPIFSLRDKISFTYHDVIERALAGNIYPYKTVKHIFNEDLLNCNYTLESLYD